MPQRWHPPVSALRLRYLLIPPILLAIATAALLFYHTDYNLVALYSQCHAHARLPSLSRLPVIGPPSCYLISFFQTAASSSRSFAVLAACLSFVAGLLTVYVVEGARVCNVPNVLIAYPTGPLLVFNLSGGAFVWELIVAPAFFHRARGILRARRAAGGRGEVGVSPRDPDLGWDLRHLGSEADAVAIPAGVLLGFILPSVLMLALDSPVAVGVWLFSPVYVAVVRWVVGVILPCLRARSIDPNAAEAETLRSLHLESHSASLALVYAAPVLCSVLSHGLLIWSLLWGRDDRIAMTRATLGFIVINVVFTGLTVLYWLFVEVGWRVVAVMVQVSVLLGPGAGVCAGWVYREARWNEVFSEGGFERRSRRRSRGSRGSRGTRGTRGSSVGAGEEEGRQPDERAPLLG